MHLFTASLRDNLTLFGAHPGRRRAGRRARRGSGSAAGGGGCPTGWTRCSLRQVPAPWWKAQLVAFARVFLHPGLVVLDEPSSRIDPVTQVQVQRAMDHLLAGRTAVVIAHWLRTLDRADQVLVLEEGRVVEHGRRPVLAIDLSTRFARLLGAERHDGHGGHGGRGGREPAGTTGRPL